MIFNFALNATRYVFDNPSNKIQRRSYILNNKVEIKMIYNMVC